MLLIGKIETVIEP